MNQDILKAIKQEALKLGDSTRAVILVTLTHDGHCEVNSGYAGKPDLTFCERVVGMHVTHEMSKTPTALKDD